MLRVQGAASSQLHLLNTSWAASGPTSSFALKLHRVYPHAITEVGQHSSRSSKGARTVEPISDVDYVEKRRARGRREHVVEPSPQDRRTDVACKMLAVLLGRLNGSQSWARFFRKQLKPKVWSELRYHGSSSSMSRRTDSWRQPQTCTQMTWYATGSLAFDHLKRAVVEVTQWCGNGAPKYLEEV